MNGQGIMQVISLLCVKHSVMIAMRTMKATNNSVFCAGFE